MPGFFVELAKGRCFSFSKEGDGINPVTRVFANEGETNFIDPPEWKIKWRDEPSKFGRLIDPFVFEHDLGGVAVMGIFGTGDEKPPEHPEDEIRLGAGEWHKFSVGTVYHMDRSEWESGRGSEDAGF